MRGTCSCLERKVSFTWQLEIHFILNWSQVAQLCLILYNPMNCSTPAFPVLHHFQEFARVHWIGDAIQPSHLLSSPPPPALNLSQHHWKSPVSWLFTSSGQSIGTSALASVLPMSIQGWFLLILTGLISLLPKGPSKVFSSTIVWKHQFFSVEPSLQFSSWYWVK